MHLWPLLHETAGAHTPHPAFSCSNCAAPPTLNFCCISSCKAMQPTQFCNALPPCGDLRCLQNTSSKAWASQHAAAAKAGMLGRETGFLLASSALACMHAAYTLLAWLVLPQLPFHTAHHAALALLWLLVAGCCSRASRRCVRVRLCVCAGCKNCKCLNGMCMSAAYVVHCNVHS